MPFSVVTSKKAQQDFLNIQARHSDILTGMINQKVKIDAFNQQRDQQKAAEMQNKQIMDNEMQKEKMTANSTDMKTALDFQTKTAEIDVKRAALSQP